MRAKKVLSIFLSTILIATTAIIPTTSYAESNSESSTSFDFYGLRVAYYEAVEKGDLDKQRELLSIGREYLDKFKETAELHNIGPRRVDATELYWRGQFSKYFHYGRFETRSGVICLSLSPKLDYWTASDLNGGWNSTFATFHNHTYWKNTECMKDQFYCHAAYGPISDEWNLEPHKTSVSPITCN